MSNKKRTASEKQNDQDAARILQSFLDFQDKGLDEFCRFLMHCGIALEDIDHAGGDIPSAILEHYRKPGGGYDWTLWHTIGSAGHRSQPASRS